MPLVSIIIVNYNGRHLLRDCLEALYHIDYPKKRFEIILVDNNSVDDSIPFVKSHFPFVHVVELSENCGFTGGNAAGLNVAIGDYIVLLNTDVVVDQSWLSALVKAAQPKDVGVVSSRLRFAVPFIELTISSHAVPRSQLNSSIDHSPIGVLLEDINCNDLKLSKLVYYKSGFYERKEAEVALRRTMGRAVALLPFEQNGKSTHFRIPIHGYTMTSHEKIPIYFSVGGKTLLEKTISADGVTEVDLEIPAKVLTQDKKWLIQNAGNIVLSNGSSKDRGSMVDLYDSDIREFYEEESEYFDKPVELLAACGAACLIKRQVIDHVGFLDGHYFMYYEDVEFSLRAWRAGWKILYEPSAIGYHAHRATTGSGESALLIELVERNRLSMVLSHFPLRTVISQYFAFFVRFCGTTAKAFLFQFYDNLERSNTWHIRYSGRRSAAIFLFRHFPRLMLSRVHLNRYWPYRTDALERMTY